ncbi:MAG TPA: hypothetical protein VGB87_04290, partial [Vicinamibacteria bacterium]
MQRRSFLGCGALAGAATVVPGGAGSAAAEEPKPFDVPAFELEEATVADLQERMAAGAWTSHRIVEAYLG